MLNLITKLTTTSTSTPAASDNDAAISDVSDTNVPDTLPPAWDNPSPVPRLSPATATSYLHTLVSRLITTGRYKKRGDALRLVTGHPHYFFRVPPSLYAASLAALDGPQRTKLSSLLQVLATLSTEEMAPLWTDDGSKLLPALRDALAGSIPDMDLYALQRLVATGQSDASTHSATDLFVLLGREEWAYRAAVVSVLLARAQHA